MNKERCWKPTSRITKDDILFKEPIIPYRHINLTLAQYYHHRVVKRVGVSLIRARLPENRMIARALLIFHHVEIDRRI